MAAVNQKYVNAAASPDEKCGKAHLRGLVLKQCTPGTTI